jgi:DNA replication protein DnaC
MNNSSQVLRELQELRKVWRTQNFSYTKEQQSRYTELTELRRAFVTYWKENNLVWVGPSNVGKASTEAPAA